ncbi:hypothetical protein RHMOL_Rhmol01G0242500 [Rhododendron molle]|uniref:Uncharacterized protein n=2 Tax=Rhododendron molle TaxID=49168 RepID=A0ACC0Q6H7_RHOML|nr:hypothetical protein RHMOL_Rhmol01G0242500 [Rhododendron molle]KAI8572969.1 hypothetical protein RHMOL_Rhmol01G0242500 [Rhododendron molle]
MDTNSSGEDLFIKARKPYTITKQRERWTEEEHNRFLEALKLYGRAWQRIEEHIGTKTAVQIRSHAQKFFTKLEKEALGKGVPIRQALDIEIPPPRPKRKPSNPYPRKTGVGTATPQVGATDGTNSSVSSFFTGKQLLDLEREPLTEKPGGDEKPGNITEDEDKGNCSEVLTLFQEAPCASFSSANEDSMQKHVGPQNSCTFREFVPMVVCGHDETNESYVTAEPKGNHKLVKQIATQTFQSNGTNDISTIENSNSPHEKSVQSNKAQEMNHPVNFGAHNYPRHVPVHVVNGSLGTINQNVSPDMTYQESIFHQMGGIQGNPNPLTNPAASATSTATTEHIKTHQSFPSFHPLSTPVHNNQGDYQTYLQVSSAFSSLLVSSLLQNSAAHAAASFAAAFWPPPASIEASTNSPVGILGGFPSRQADPPPSMAAIVAATVAAATAWWASHGLLPLCTSFHNGFNCTPGSVLATQVDGGPTATCTNGKRENTPRDLPLQNQQLDTEFSEAVQEQNSASKLPTSSSSDSGESEGAKPKTGLTAANQDNAAVVTELPDSNKTKGRKPVDRSSCGSNSGSDFETDALEKHENEKEELKEADVSLPACDFGNRRCRPSSSTNDSWKEVSEEGRLAFRALFSRQILPQSFSPPQDTENNWYQMNEKDMQNTDEKAEDASPLRGTCSIHHPAENSSNALLRGQKDGEEGWLRMDLGLGKLKHCRTGFKPYKRCSVEAKESKVASVCSQGEQKAPKRLRLEGEASI